MNQETIYFLKILKKILHPETECLIAEEVDWTRVVQLARVHNVLPLFQEEAVHYASYIERPAYVDEMQEVLAIVATQVKHTEVFLKLYQDFVKVGVYPIVMKGLICRELYGKFADHRPSGDEDILIRPLEYQKVKAVLTANGFITEVDVVTEAQLEQLQEITFVNPSEKVCIELHLNPMGRENDVHSRMSDCFKNVFDNYREVEVRGVMVRTMSHYDHLLFLILHAARHFMAEGFGVRQMLDILLYQERYGLEIETSMLYETLRKFRLEKLWADMLYIGNTYLGFTIPMLYEPNCPEELLGDLISCGVFGNDTQAKRVAGRMLFLSTGNYLKQKSDNRLLSIWKIIFPSKGYMLKNAPYLQEKPWLLPLEWIKRWVRFARKSCKKDGVLSDESAKIKERRKSLLKKYNLV